MFDGSTLPLGENLRLSAQLLDRCRELAIVLEVECGAVGGEEDGVGDASVSRDRLYTTPDDLLRGAEALGTGGRGRYLLAATFGNVHGVYAPGRVRLRPEILADGQDALERAAAEHMIEHRDGVLPAEPERADKRAYDPRGLGRPGRDRDGQAGGAGLRAARLRWT
jgi:fructose/tagatose bisphosphate aldolase